MNEEKSQLPTYTIDQIWGNEGGLMLKAIQEGRYTKLQILDCGYVGNKLQYSEKVLSEITLEPYRAVRLKDGLQKVMENIQKILNERLAVCDHIPQAEKKVGGDTEMPILHDCCEATCQVCGKVNWVVGGDTGAKE